MKNREIKFRAWDSISKKMHNWNTINNTNLPLSDFIKLEHYHLMQFTGLKDKNGVDIYEGDIVQNKKIKGDVKWNNYSFVVYDKNDDYMLLGLASFWEFEVIGNIHLNPELCQTT